MKRLCSNSRKANLTLRLAFSLALIAFVPLLLRGSAPSWWSQRGVLVENATPDDYAPANQGQLRNIANAAAAEMDAKLPGGAGDVIHELIQSWSTSSTQRNDFAPINLGQLKAIAKPFYDRLIAADLATQYPWTNAPSEADDFAIANIGQVKNLFRFELPILDPLYDGDHNGLPDAWERQYFGSIGVDPNADPDGDGVSNLQEYVNRTDPNDFFNGTLAALTITGGGDQRGAPGTLLPVPVSVRVGSVYFLGVANAPVTVMIAQGGARLVAGNAGISAPSLELTLRANGYDEQGYPVAQFYVLLPQTPDISVIRASTQGGTQSLSVSTTAVAVDTSLVAPTNLSVTATFPSSARLTWTAAGNTSPTTVQASIDGGKTWITLGTVAAGLTSATVTGLTPGKATKFRLFSGATASANDGTSFALPDPSSASPPSPPPGPGGGGASDSADVVPLALPVLEVDQAEYDYGHTGGYLGISGKLYKNKEIVVRTHFLKSDYSEEYEGSTTNTFAWVPGNESYGRGDREVTGTVVTGEYGGQLFIPYRTVVSTDTLLLLESTDLYPPGSTASKTITLSNPFTNADAEAAGAAAHLQFYGEFYEPDANESYHAYFSHGHGNYDIIVAKYRFRVNADPNVVVLWDVQFTPENGGTVQHDLQSWHGDGSTYSPEFLLDPRVLSAGQSGTYRVVLIDAELVPDYNRDGKIDSADRHHVTTAAPWHWWINNDDDSGDTEGTDISHDGAVPNFATTDAHPESTDTGVVDGTRDLIDFFPLYLNIKSLVDLLSPTDGFTYNLKQDGGSANFVYTDLSAAAPFDYLHKLTGTAYDNAITLGGAPHTTGAVTHHITLEGVALDPQWLQGASRDGYGILLIEARARTDKPIVLQVFSSNGHKMVEVEFPVSFSPVEQMFRHKNLMNGDNATDGAPDYATGNDTQHNEPENYPDSLCNNKTFIFVHGYNVNPDAARGWNAETFKRMYHAGSKAKFIGVTWHGDETHATAVPDYQLNVDNAFATAKSLAELINKNSHVIVVGHSLGNVVVGSAIEDWNASVEKYFMIDAAAPLESYGADTFFDDAMIHPEWLRYQERLWASEWHGNRTLSPDDGRRQLTWRSRFDHVSPHGYNFFSSGEDVLRKHTGNPAISSVVEAALTGGRFAWALQEKLKGRQINLGIGKCGSTYGGWQFSQNLFGPAPVSPEQAAQLSDSTLTAAPVFDPGFTTRFSPPPPAGDPPKEIHDGAPAWITDLTNPPTASTTASAHRNQLLAEMFPSRSLPAGANLLPNFEDRNFDMPTLYTNGWPAERGAIKDWLHSDIKVVAYSYIYRLFEKWTKLGELDK